MGFRAGTQAVTSILSLSDLVQTKKRWKCGEKECFPLWMNCFTISYLLGSGNVRSGDLSSHKSSHRVDRLQRSQGRYAQPHTALGVHSLAWFSLENTSLSCFTSFLSWFSLNLCSEPSQRDTASSHYQRSTMLLPPLLPPPPLTTRVLG